MPVRRVFVFWTHPIFHDSVRLLLAHPQILWVGATSDYAANYEQILISQPDTILVEEVNGLVPPEIMHVLEKSQWNVRVVGLNLHDNQVQVYHRVQRSVGKADDLLNWIINEYS
jgi:hypothetical protein